MKHIIQSFKPFGGRHCITTSMRQVFVYHGHDLSEEMLLGLGSGLSFFYAEWKFMSYPFIGMRAKIGEFEENLGQALNIGIQMHETDSAKKAYAGLKDLISQDVPVMMYVDMPFLKYLNLPEDAHFGGHSIVVFGIDEEERIAYVSDRDEQNHTISLNPNEIPADFHTVTLQELEQARGSRHKPFPPKNRWVSFDFSSMKPLDQGVILPAIRKTAENMLNPPIKNVGLKGIQLCSQKVPQWAAFDDEKLKWSAFNGFIMINQTGGTGGGGFRKMYGNFLRESGQILDSAELSELGNEYFAAGEEWDQVADQFYDIFETIDRDALKPISERILSLHAKETEFMIRLKSMCDV